MTPQDDERWHEDPDLQHPQHSRSLLFGAWVSTLLPTISMLAMTMAAGGVLIGLLVALVIVFPMALGSSFLLGLPVAYFLRVRGWLSVWPLLVAGALVGAVVLAIFSYHNSFYPQMRDRALAEWIAWNAARDGALGGALAGGIGALAFAVGSGVRWWPLRKRAVP